MCHIPIGHILLVEVLPLILCTHTHACTPTHACTHTQCMHTYTCAHAHAPTHTCAHTPACTHMCTLTRVSPLWCRLKEANAAVGMGRMQTVEEEDPYSSTSSQCWTTPQSHLRIWLMSWDHHGEHESSDENNCLNHDFTFRHALAI